jgi:Outer membrane protein beta-barrel domain
MRTRYLACCAALWFFACVPLLQAQEANRFEMSAGYSLLRLDTRSLGLTEYTNANGGYFGLGMNFRPWLGVVADLSANYGSNAGNRFRSYLLLAGPEVTYRRGRSNFLAHALFGAARNAVSGLQATDSGRAWAVGAGYDYRFSPFWSVRVVQADYVRSSTFSTTQKDLRLSVGIALHFGRDLNQSSP